LTLYFASSRPGGSGDFDIYVTTRRTTDAPWEDPVNLGPTVNSSAYDNHPSISADGLTLYFDSRRTDANGRWGLGDLYVTRRASLDDGWGPPEILAVNTNGREYSPDISRDNRTLYYDSPLAGRDLWAVKRASAKDDWVQGVNMGEPFNTAAVDTDPSISVRGSLLYFVSARPGGHGGFDIWLMPTRTKRK
jgi:Tol biopolymer transport system component